MFDYLINHALKNAWCSPRQDLQVILKPARISSARGTHTTANHLWDTLPLPTSKDQYHLYQIGQLHPSLLGLFPQRRVWHTLAHVMGLENLIADLYTGGGLRLPRFESWVLVTEERDVVLAVREQPRIADLKTEPVYLRLYSNSYFSSDRADSAIDKIVARGIRVKDAQQALDFQRDYLNSKALRGLTTLFVNGVYVHDFRPNSVMVDDVIEYVYDSTVKSVIDLDIEDLQTFDSTLDGKRKYLLHYTDAQVGGETIDYRDDIDIYLIQKDTASAVTKWKGVYYHKNQNDALRMVTHRDYTIPVPYVNGYLSSIPSWVDVQDLTVRVVIRHAGWHRPLINEHHRIKELYKLSEEDRMQALLGIDSSVPVWHADALESSYYPKVMDAYGSDIDASMVQYAYGYNAMAKLVGESPLKVEVVSGRRQVTLPPGLQVNSTMFEYGPSGKLLGFYYHTAGAEYTPINPATTLVEGIVGKGAYKMSVVFGEDEVLVDPAHDTRFYTAPIENGHVLHDQWTDVTGDDSKYMIVGGKAIWLTDPTITATAVKSDKEFLAYDLTLSPNNGLLKFSIDGDAIYPDTTAHGVMHIPVGTLDLWLNGRALIEGLDYFVEWPQVVVTNKAYLVTGPTQKITVRGTGFCRPDMSREPAKEAGFVEYGLLSRNNRFNVRDDKVIRIVAGGAVYHRSALLFSEEDHGVRMENVPNGTPYVINDTVVPLHGLVGETTFTMRDTALEVDDMIEDYLTARIPESPRTLPDMIEGRYPIYSPFSSVLIYDMLNGVLSMENFTGQYSDMDVMDFLQDYLYLLEYDPTQKSVDLDHVEIHPHNLNTEMVLNIYQYNFLNRAIKIYLDDKVDITNFVSIKPGYI